MKKFVQRNPQFRMEWVGRVVELVKGGESSMSTDEQQNTQLLALGVKQKNPSALYGDGVLA